jgi:hypothetical protein
MEWAGEGKWNGKEKVEHLSLSTQDLHPCCGLHPFHVVVDATDPEVPYVWPGGLGCALSCFTAHEFDGLGAQVPKRVWSTKSSASILAGVGKFVTISKQAVTAVEDRDVLACGCTIAGM